MGARSFLPDSACRHAGRTISSPEKVFGIWSLRILEASFQSFLLIFRTVQIVTYTSGTEVADVWSTDGYSDVPAFSRIYRQQGLTVSRRSKPSSRAALMGEQPNPWEVLPPQDATSRHRTCLRHFWRRRLYLHPAQPKARGRRFVVTIDLLLGFTTAASKGLSRYGVTCGSLYLKSSSKYGSTNSLNLGMLPTDIRIRW